MTDRLDAQLAFVLELDKAKNVLRQSLLADGSRRENDAEHMWHVAVAAAVLAEHAAEPVDIGRVVQLLLVHDVVEIDAGDVLVYDEAARAAQEEREREAAERIYGLLPPDQADAFRGLWEEFEARETPESRYAAAIDRLQPMLLNLANRGEPWRRHGIGADRVRAVNAVIGLGAPAVWDRARAMLDGAVADGYLPEG